MFSRKKPDPPKRRQHNLSQFGLFDIPDNFDPAAGISGEASDDSDLEAELAQISGETVAKPTGKRKPKVPISDLDKMIADCLRDVSDNDDGSDDMENDPELLDELRAITETETKLENEDLTPHTEPIILPTTVISTVDLIKNRIKMYEAAESTAKSAGESIKVRRYARGLKTLQELLKQASAGKSINVEDIPPEVFVKSAESASLPEDSQVEERNVPTRPAPLPPAPTNPTESTPAELPISEDSKQEENVGQNTSSDISRMRNLQNEYRIAALQAKRSGDTPGALQLMKVYKQFDVVIKMCEDGKEVDLSDMPPPPNEYREFLAKMQQQDDKQTKETENSDTNTNSAPTLATETESSGTMLEALQLRLEKYKSVQDAAKSEGNSSKVRRYGRIVDQYESAIKNYKAGKPVVYDELPAPPGFGPLPVEKASTSEKPEVTPSPSSTASTSVSSTTPADRTPSSTPAPPPRKSKPADLTTRITGNQQKNSQSELQMKILLERQSEYKQAAINAKKSGEIEQAKEYLKIYKGFEALLNAASSGLPVDLSTLPVPPSQRENLEASFAIVTAEDCDPNDDISDIGLRMEEQLAKQLMMCKNTRDHYKAMGNIAGMNRFENLALTVQKDLDVVRYSKRKNFALPKFHYEKRSFDIIHCNTDLTDNELELMIVRGLNYNVKNPKEVDTYVIAEFPLLNDEKFKVRTNLIKDTDSPDYSQRFKIEIQRGNRQFQRIFKRSSVKFEVYSRGGFLRSDILIGTVSVKLQPLETKCDIHDTFELMEGRKKVGGKLELKLRVRNPIHTKQIEHIDEKWLVLET